MRARGTTIQQIILGLALVAALCWNLAQAAEIKGIQLSSGATGTRAELSLPEGATWRTLTLTGPDRLVVDVQNVSNGAPLRVPAAAGIVKAVRTGQPSPGTTRIVFDLAAPVAVLKPRVEPAADGPRLVLEWPGDGPADTAARPATQSPAVATAPPPVTTPTTSPAQVPPQPQAQAKPPVTQAAAPAPEATPPGRTLQDLRVGTRPLVIAIDAGHGGQDPGAIGPSGTREKDITLAIARELARQINATPGLKAVLVRDSDMFLPLPRRTAIARQHKADMFISVHADAAENRNARGSSVYVLSLRGASSQRARWLADKENAADLIGGAHSVPTDGTLASVLLDLTQSGQMKASEDAAAQVLSGLKKIGFNHKPNIERANFAVLRTSDMPAMLVETAFISNVEEERRLNDPSYRRQLAAAILDGIDTYFERQPPPGTLYAARAKAEQQRSEATTPARNTAPAPALLQPQPVVTATAPSSTTGGSP